MQSSPPALLATTSESDTELGHLHEQGALSRESLWAYILHLTCVSGDVVSSLHALISLSRSLGPAGALRQETEAASYREGIRPSQSFGRLRGLIWSVSHLLHIYKLSTEGAHHHRPVFCWAILLRSMLANQVLQVSLVFHLTASFCPAPRSLHSDIRTVHKGASD